MINISDGKSDGFVLFYAKEGKIYPVVLNSDQLKYLELMISGIGDVSVINEVQGEITNYIKKRR